MSVRNISSGSDGDGGGCGCVLVILIIIFACVIGKKKLDSPAATTAPATTVPSVMLPADNIAVDTVSALPSGVGAWISPEALFLSSNEVFVKADAEIFPEQKPDYIKISRNGNTYSINLSGTKHKWKVPLEATTPQVAAVKISNVEQEIPVEK